MLLLWGHPVLTPGPGYPLLWPPCGRPYRCYPLAVPRPSAALRAARCGFREVGRWVGGVSLVDVFYIYSVKRLRIFFLTHNDYAVIFGIKMP